MASFKRAIENSLLSVENGLESKRIVEIQEVKNPAKRAGLLALHGAVARFPDRLADHFGLRYKPKELSNLEPGLQSEVFRLGRDTVIKVIKEHDGAYNPIILTPAERSNLAEQLREEHEVMSAYLGRTVIPHDIRVGKHPIQRDRMAILITQPYCELDFLQLSDDDEDTAALRQRLKAAQEIHPNVISEMSGLTFASRLMYEERQLATDIVGRNNVGIDRTSGSVVIVDSQPVPTDRPSEQELAIRHLNRLDSVLATMAA